MAKIEFDKEAAQKLLTVYITPDVVQQRKEFLDAIALKIGERVLDVGSGPGFLAREIADRVGIKGSVCGVDISEYLIEVAKEHNRDVPTVSFKYGGATDLIFESEEFDAVVSTQVLEYVPDVDAALREFHRVLKRGGKVAILDTDWDSIVWRSSDRTRMSRILKAWEPHVSDPFLPKTLKGRMMRAGFKVDAIQVIPLLNPKYDPNTYSNLMIDFVVSYVTENNMIGREEAASWSVDLRAQDDQEGYFFSLNRYLFLGTKV